jgi:signal transduction histidine kinase
MQFFRDLLSGGTLARLRRKVTLSQRFFLIALGVVVAAVFLLGNWTSSYVSESIGKGVGGTAADSIEALISDRLDGSLSSPEQRAALEDVFQVVSNADSTRLLQIRVHDTTGSTVFESVGGIEDIATPEQIERTLTGVQTVRVLDLPLRPIGELPRSMVSVLKIEMPLRRLRTAEVFGAAELYYSARTVRELQRQARSDVWIIAGSIGFVSIGTLALLVDVTGNIISGQRQRLARTLRETRSLLKQNLALQTASEQLRTEASLANENVLAQVGSDIHDGPVQLLTLLILRLTRETSVEGSGGAPSGAMLAQEALENLRGISAGLVLPELANLSVAQTVALAASRHENLTGTKVRLKADVAKAVASTTAKVCIYRVIQEALNNAYRHGGGLDQRVAVTVREGWLRIEITNRLIQNGHTTSSADQVGLRAMRFRVESQGGLLAVSFAGDVARIDARIPIGRAAG